MGAFQSTTMRERAQALLAGAVTLAMAASLAVVGAPAQQAYADEDVAVAVQATDIAEGSYLLDAVMLNYSTYGTDKQSEFNVSGTFDPHFKLVKDAEGTSLSMLYVGQVPLKSMTIDDDADEATGMVEAVKSGYGARNVDGSYGAYEYTMPIGSLEDDHLITFDMGFHQASVYLRATRAPAVAFGGYDDSAFTQLGSRAAQYIRGSVNAHSGKETPAQYTADVSVLNAGNLSRPSMAAGCISGPATLKVASDGAVNVTVELREMTVGSIKALPKRVAVYQEPDNSGQLVEGAVETVDGVTTLAFAMPDSCREIDGVFVNFAEIEGMNGMSPDAFLALKYDGEEPDIQKVEEAQARVRAAAEAAEKEEADRKAQEESAKAAKAEADLANASVTVAKASMAYTGKAQTPDVAVKSKSGKVLKSGTDYAVSYSANKDAGTAKVTVFGKGAYTGENSTATFKITQASNSVKVAKASVKKSFKKSAVKKKAQSVALPKATAKFGTAKWSVAKKDPKKVLSLKNGKVVVKKGAKKDTYTIKLKASVAKTANYKAASTKAVTVKVTVK